MTGAYFYHNGHLYGEGVRLADIAEEVGTPTYVYSQAAITHSYREIDRAFAAVPHIVCFSLKSNSNLAISRLLAGLGAGADIVSGGELFKAIEAGFDPGKIVYASVGKTVPEIEYALQNRILMFNVESQAEMETIAAVAERLHCRAPIALRLNPDIEAKTHPYITTGMKQYKFGIPTEEALTLYQQAMTLPSLEPVGIQMHIGSQLLKVQPIVDAARKLLEVYDHLREMGLSLRYVDIGGGLGITYRDEAPEGPQVLAKTIVPMIKERDCTLIVEPGRFIVGNAGVLLTRVLYIKRNELKKFVIVDAAMNDLIRPALYDAYHAILPLVEKRETEVVDVVGPVCESGDFLAREREMVIVEQGELLAVQSAGAYGFSMSSNYNARPRAAEVLVSGDHWKLVRRRETYEDLVRGEDQA
ncbi:MAG: diaminopimelate decarboxylase [Chloroflexi bacterium]|nr:diaminopimelate decarboxylase [Chloroflexota bacterium]MCL5074924.1 diaminopimelate decarboxylase [Chloroflexota bacterium]